MTRPTVINQVNRILAEFGPCTVHDLLDYVVGTPKSLSGLLSREGYPWYRVKFHNCPKIYLPKEEE